MSANFNFYLRSWKTHETKIETKKYILKTYSKTIFIRLFKIPCPNSTYQLWSWILHKLFFIIGLASTKESKNVKLKLIKTIRKEKERENTNGFFFYLYYHY